MPGPLRVEERSDREMEGQSQMTRGGQSQYGVLIHARQCLGRNAIRLSRGWERDSMWTGSQRAQQDRTKR